MRYYLVAWTALAVASPVLAQEAAREPAEQSPIDDLVNSDSIEPAAEALKPTGDPLLDRLNALETRLRKVEARNAELEAQAELNQGRLESVETRAAKAAQFTWAPTTADPSGNFSFKPRGVVEVDAFAFLERKGGYDYNNGTALRRARLGVEGTALKWFNYRLEVDFAGNAVNVTDAYLQYTKIPRTILTVGQHKAPFGLESNNSDNYNIFLERGMFTNAFGAVGAERRIGVSAAYAPKETISLAVGLFGDNESVGRSTGASLTDAPDESWGVNARATFEPLFEPGKIVHLGLAGYYRSDLKAGDVADAVRLTERPNIRGDNGNIIDSGVITGAKSLLYGGAEAAVVLGPLMLSGEYGRLRVVRVALPNETFSGFYLLGSYFLTGETRPFRAGNFDRVRPFRELGRDGLGAFELAARYDRLDVSNTPVLARRGNQAHSATLGLNWFFNPFAKLMVNWVHFWGENSPLDPIGARTKGDALATRLHLDF